MRHKIAILHSAAAKFGSGGKVVATEPYFQPYRLSSSSIFITNRSISGLPKPELDHVEGPLTSANIALPWLMFFRRREWLQRLNDHLDLASRSVRHFTALSYMITGGTSHKFPILGFLYRATFPIDLALSRYFPRLCAAFFTITLTRR